MSAPQEAFEHVMAKHHLDFTRRPGFPDCYRDDLTRMAFLAWLEAQAAMPQRVPMTEAQKIDIMDTTHVMTTRMERAIARWFKAQPLREAQAETPVEPRVEDLAMQARAAALEEAALLVESRCDMPEELAAIERSKAAAEDGDDARQLSALRHWSTVSLYNSVFRRVAADIRAVKAPTVGAKP